MTDNNLTFRDYADMVKERINCLDYAHDMGMDLHKDSNSFRSTSPFMGGNNDTCFTIYQDNLDFFIDWKAGLKGDVIKFAAELNHGGDQGAALQELIKKTGIKVESLNTSVTEYRTKLKQRTDKINHWHDELLKNDDLMEYIHSRNITDKTIQELKLGYSADWEERIIVPYINNGSIVYYAGRLLPNYTPTKKKPKYRKARKDGYNHHICWGSDTLKRDMPLIIAEGAFDAISFYQEGYSVIASLGGEFNAEQLQEIVAAARLKECKNKDVILIFDTDSAGQGFTKKLSKVLFNAKVPFKTATVPNYKDVSEYYQDNNEVRGILETAQDGLIYLASTFKNDKEGFSDFILKAARHLSSPDIAELFSVMKHEKMFDEAWLKELEKLCKKPPAETTIVYEILKKRQLLHTEHAGFYEFNGKVWEKKDDTFIHKIIKDIMGRFANGSKLTSITKLLAAECHSNIEFNKKRLMTFKNGTLELDTKRFRKSRYNDYVSILLPYEYDPDAKCPTFVDFLKSVTDGDIEKASLLQEVTGYCLFPENTLQKCVNLIGNGSNGKSVYANIVQELFGSENVSHVRVSDLDNQFSRIHLKDSLINLCFEEKPNVSEANEVFKSITAGDSIEGCYKHKDSIEFIPHAKMIVASNSPIAFSDPSDAIPRRMLFIQFTEKYVMDREPLYPHEHKADINLLDKLRKELSGIFNWTLGGYDRLKKNNQFSITEESKQLLQDYRETINPIYEFIKTLDLDSLDKIVTKDYYYHFKTWAIDNGRNTVSSDTFTKRFNTTFGEIYHNWQKKRYNNGIGWEKIADEEVPAVHEDYKAKHQERRNQKEWAEMFNEQKADTAEQITDLILSQPLDFDWDLYIN